MNVNPCFTFNGNVIMPFAEVFWGGKFGMLTDKFGVRWMVSGPH